MSPSLRRVFQVAALALAFATSTTTAASTGVSEGPSTTTKAKRSSGRRPYVGETVLKAKLELEKQERQRKLDGIELGKETAEGKKEGGPKATIDIVIKYDDDAPKLPEWVEELVEDTNLDIGALSIASVKVTSDELEALIDWGRKGLDHGIHAIELDHGMDVQLYSEDNSPTGLRGGDAGSGRGRKLNEEKPYGLDMVQADKMADLNEPPPAVPIKVCVVDTGYDNDHPDLPDLNNDDGYSPYSDEAWDIDGHSHGTHVAGTIGAIGGNGEGVNSIFSYNGDSKNEYGNRFTFWIGKGLKNSGSGSMSAVLEAVELCYEAAKKEGARAVVNLSLGSNETSTIEKEAYDKLFDQGVLIVAAAGNKNSDMPMYPSSFNSAMAVAAVDSNGNKAPFSSYHDQVEIAAPGMDIKSTLNNDGIGGKSGTSMAAPHVAGVAALVWSYFPECTNLQIRNALVATAEGNGCNQYYGAGIVKAKNAYDALKANGCAYFNKHHPMQPHKLAFGGCEQTHYCPDGDLIESSIQLDNYPQETSAEVERAAGTENITILEVAQGTYTGLDGVQNAVGCAREDGTYYFRIHDSYGDGICCGYGDGSYAVYVGGEKKIEGNGVFGPVEEYGFDVTMTDDGNDDPDDPCDPDPCLNGSCNADGSCTCSSGWMGDTCDAVEHCASSPCSNGGQCTPEVDGYTCTCSSGWMGDTCDAVDHCASSPCANGGQCTAEVDGYTCTCSSGWMGGNCDEVDHCASSPCANGGQCTAEVDGYTCTCTSGWMGVNCDSVDHCYSDPCEAGTCSIEGDAFKCTCTSGWMGDICDTFDHCASAPCVNGACSVEGDGYSCDCFEGFNGIDCETAVAAGGWSDVFDENFDDPNNRFGVFIEKGSKAQVENNQWNDGSSDRYSLRIRDDVSASYVATGNYLLGQATEARISYVFKGNNKIVNGDYWEILVSWDSGPYESLADNGGKVAFHDSDIYEGVERNTWHELEDIYFDIPAGKNELSIRIRTHVTGKGKVYFDEVHLEKFTP